MPTRRTFIKQAALAGAITTSIASAHCTDLQRVTAAVTGRTPRRLNSGSIPQVESLTRRDETIIRNTAAHGDNWHMTWAQDDLQYVCLCDGRGPLDPLSDGYNSRLLSIEGEPSNHKFHDVQGYPHLNPDFPTAPRYYNFGIIAFDANIYQFLSTWSVPAGKNGDADGLRFTGVKAIHSPDNGRTWRNQNGSTPVIWESWEQRSKETMLFFNEPQDAFSMLSVLQMGRGYKDNRDGFVYVYAPNGNTEGTMNQLVMFRVPKTQILRRSSYEYFSGLSANGEAKWTKKIDERGIVHTFPSGWVNNKNHPWAWLPSVTYNAPLGLYMMANWGTSAAPDANGKWFHKPSYLGFWTSPQPWGPWTQVHEEIAWVPEGDTKARCYSPIISPKWIAEDGRSFWLVWTDYMQLDPNEFPQIRNWLVKLNNAEMQRSEFTRLIMPYYSFNIQRVDLTVG